MVSEIKKVVNIKKKEARKHTQSCPFRERKVEDCPLCKINDIVHLIGNYENL